MRDTDATIHGALSDLATVRARILDLQDSLAAAKAEIVDLKNLLVKDKWAMEAHDRDVRNRALEEAAKRAEQGIEDLPRMVDEVFLEVLATVSPKGRLSFSTRVTRQFIAKSIRFMKGDEPSKGQGEIPK